MLFIDILILLSPTLAAALWLMIRRGKKDAAQPEATAPRREPPPPSPRGEPQPAQDT